MKETLKRLQEITKGCRDDMHEPDEQEIRAVTSGCHLDNAMGNDPYNNSGEFTIGIINGLTNQTEWFNLATLIALARKAKL
uniref:Uncharacterized protein n=1 Tax=viral metagenome TaxID=1070528 RepID=A0A6M3LBT6_9ZZZZ